MNNRTSVLFLILCMVVLLGLLELEKVWFNSIDKVNIKLSESSSYIENEEIKNIFTTKIKHDGNPETNTAKITLDAGSSYDPNKVDKLRFKWKQISGSNVKLSPNMNMPRVTFSAPAGSYSFEISLSDGYSNAIKDTQNVIIIEEKNELPILETKIIVE